MELCSGVMPWQGLDENASILRIMNSESPLEYMISTFTEKSKIICDNLDL